MGNDRQQSSTTLPPEYAGERNMESFWAEIEPRHEPMRKRWFLPVVLLLLVLSVPWYLSDGFASALGTVGLDRWSGPLLGFRDELYGGLPAWIWIALVCSLAIAGVTAFVCLRHWDDEEIGVVGGDPNDGG